MVNYGWPSISGVDAGIATGYLLQAKGFVDSIIVTAHVATGSLDLGCFDHSRCFAYAFASGPLIVGCRQDKADANEQGSSYDDPETTRDRQTI